MAGSGHQLLRTAGQPPIGYLDSRPTGDTAVVLLHSLGTDHRLWLPQLDALSGAHRVIAWDSRGHGTSGWREPLSAEDWATDLLQLLDHAQVARAALVGLSMGGIQAIAAAARDPQRVSALVLADTFAELDEDIAQAKISGLAGRARRDGMAHLARSYVDETFTARPLPTGAEFVRDAIAGMRADAYVASVSACFGARMGERLADVRAPTLVLWGGRDEKSPRALSERIAADIDGAVLREIPDAGHLSNLENPEEFNRNVRTFLDQVHGTTTGEQEEVS
jgi:3-oxoadipate enol-lactonase